MLELVLQGTDLLFKCLQGWSFHLSCHSPGGYSCVYRAVFPPGPREGFLQHKLSPLGFLQGIFSIATSFSITSCTPQAAGTSSLQLLSSKLEQAAPSASPALILLMDKPTELQDQD